MSVTTKISYKGCDSGSPTSGGYAIDPSSAITSGTTYTLSGKCVEILSVFNGILTPPTITFDAGPYADCRECYGTIYDYVAATDCINKNTYYFEFSGFTGTPLINEVYFMETLDNKGGSVYNCFEMISYGNFDPLNPVSYRTIQGTPTLSTTCDGCLNSSFLTYEVINCIDNIGRYVGLSSSYYAGHLITYVDVLGEQYCGVVGVSPVFASQDVTFISDYGLFVHNCDECNSQVAEQRILTNCITNEDEIVWNSLFFNGGESSNLSSVDGCFSVGDIVTGETVTINEFLNFDPQPSCAECIECNGIQYNSVSCNGTGPVGNYTYTITPSVVLVDGDYILTGYTNGSGQYATFNVRVVSGSVNDVTINNDGISYAVGDTITILGENISGGTTPENNILIDILSVASNQSILSYQYLENPIGVVYYDPIFNECQQIVSSEAPTNYTWLISSLSTFESCLDCTGSTEHYVWYGTECGSIGDSVAITTGVGFGVGDIVKVRQGDFDFLCYELNDVYNYGVHGPLNSYNSLTTESYSTCDECKGTVRIGVSVLSCETNETSYVNIPLNAWYAVAGYSQVFEGLIISDYQGNCYRVINSCPINAGGGNLDVQHIFTSCSVCYDFYHPVIHVNQYYEAIIVGAVNGPGDESQIVTFNTPHPIWTDGDDTRRTLIQDNSITLGGFNGLNN